MIDTHSHLDDKRFDGDREEIISRAFSGGVEKIINVGADLESSTQSVGLAGRNKNIFAAVGLHPHIFNQAGEFSKKIQSLGGLAADKKVVAIGEIGLDYFSHTGEKITEAQKKNQQQGFIAQLELARDLDLPAIIHCRASKDDPIDAYEDAYRIINVFHSMRVVFHCYGGGLEFTRKIIQETDAFFSFTGNITYVKAGSEAIEVLKAIPLERMMLETDCPYLAPVPHRGKRNEPAYIAYVKEKIAEIKEIPAQEIDRITTENARLFFKLG
ncbi:MAG: TatD family hydrolase [Candidatus Moranbacteria bacterium]|nr:TatD family hydrolase [bacterium]MDP1833582.1 TatD family hydrolase [Candidatus Moranbacteria bacterium]